MNHDIVYVLSESFPYHLLYVTDAGPAYAAQFDWKTCHFSEISQFPHRTKILDPHLAEDECAEIDRLVSLQELSLFLPMIGDPYTEENENRPYYKMLVRLAKAPNVSFVTRYLPSELIQTLDEISGGQKMMFLPYPVERKRVLAKAMQGRRRKVIFSGNPTERIYPDRYRFLRGVRRRPFLWPFVDILEHPGYPDTGTTGPTPSHNIVGDRYVEHLSEYCFMFLDPSRCDLEFLKYRECAYAGCAPIGRAASSLPKEARDSILELNYEKLGRSLLRLFAIGISELQERANRFREALLREREPAQWNQNLCEFIGQSKERQMSRSVE